MEITTHKSETQMRRNYMMRCGTDESRAKTTRLLVDYASGQLARLPPTTVEQFDTVTKRLNTIDERTSAMHGEISSQTNKKLKLELLRQVNQNLVNAVAPLPYNKPFIPMQAPVNPMQSINPPNINAITHIYK